MGNLVAKKEFWTLDIRRDCVGREHLEVIARCATAKCARVKKFSARGFQVEVKPIRAARRSKSRMTR